MNMTNLIALAILIGLTALSGVVSAVLVVKWMQRRIANGKVQLEQPRIENLIFVIELKDDENDTVVRWTANVSSAEITAGLVERWLTNRDLVMAPKGKDFKPTAATAKVT